MGDILDKLLYLNACLKKCDINHILLTWQADTKLLLSVSKFKKRLCGQRFSTDNELKYATEELLKE